MEAPPRPVRPAPRPPVRVMGMPAEVVAMCFAEADNDRDGVIDGTPPSQRARARACAQPTPSIWTPAGRRGAPGRSGGG